MAPSLFCGMELIQKEFCLLVPVDKAGLLLGTKGSTIETIRYSSGCQVKMYKDKLPYSDERIFYIPGREDILDKMIAAVTEALEILMQDKLTYQYIHYSPHAVNPEDFLEKDCGGYTKAYIDKYGIQTSEDVYGQYTAGYGDYSNYGNTTSNYTNATSNYGNASSNYGNTYSTNNNTNSGSNTGSNNANINNNTPAGSYNTDSMDQNSQYQQWNNAMSNYQQSGNMGYDASSYGYGDMSAMSLGDDDFMNEEVTKELVIDDDYTSYIIGPKGSRIKAVRDKTSSVIRIGEDNTVVERRRQITIKGRVKEVMWAYKAIQGLLREAMQAKQPAPIPGIPGDVFEQSVLFRYLSDKHPFIPCDNNSTEQETRLIEIDNAKTGAVIGVKAIIISEIRKVSNCKVIVEKDSEIVGDKRKITLTGTPKEVHLADYLISAVQLYPNLTRQIKDVMLCGY